MLLRHHWANTSKSGLFYSRKYSLCFTDNPTIYRVDLWRAWKITMKGSLSMLFWLLALKWKSIEVLYCSHLICTIFVVLIKRYTKQRNKNVNIRQTIGWFLICDEGLSTEGSDSIDVLLSLQLVWDGHLLCIIYSKAFSCPPFYAVKTMQAVCYSTKEQTKDMLEWLNAGCTVPDSVIINMYQTQKNLFSPYKGIKCLSLLLDAYNVRRISCFN